MKVGAATGRVADGTALGPTCGESYQKRQRMIEAAATNVQILHDAEVLASFTRDIEKPGNIFGWTYLLTKDFVRHLLPAHRNGNTLCLIVDTRMHHVAADLQAEIPYFKAWRWSYNRTMHDKTWLFPDTGVIYIGTHNLTHGSYWLSLNRSVRIESRAISTLLMEQWNQDKERAIKNQTTKPKEEKQP